MFVVGAMPYSPSIVSSSEDFIERHAGPGGGSQLELLL
jgi:hypothetical protein